MRTVGTVENCNNADTEHSPIYSDGQGEKLKLALMTALSLKRIAKQKGIIYPENISKDELIMLIEGK